MWVQVEDKGDYLLVTYGPLRWALCGMGKEKFRYEDIKDHAITNSCAYGHGIAGCTALKLFSSCSCCCGHKIVRLSINERYQGEKAGDNSDCCLESCCLKCCCGQAQFWGSGACCVCFNPCRNNCCLVNTVHISTNDADGLLKLLDTKCIDSVS
eukprot:281539_1